MDGRTPAPPLVLASRSPRRHRLLEEAGVSFEIRPADIPEEHQLGEQPEAFARRLSAEKALAVSARLGDPEGRAVLGADTIVVIGESILGKPRDPAHAVELLGRLLGEEHRVITAVTLVTGPNRTTVTEAVQSRVTMRTASLQEIRDYVATGEPLDKAGAYALQGLGRRFVERVEGSETNVIGLPIEETLALLEQAGIPSEAR
jgi:septum formation protein